MAQTVKDPPAMQETQVPSLGQEDPLEEGNSNPFQYSCLKNSMDQGDCCSPWDHKESYTTEQLTLSHKEVSWIFQQKIATLMVKREGEF